MNSYNEFCDAISAKIFKIIDEHGSLLTWQRTWGVQGNGSLPIGSNGLYRGLNLLNLLTLQLDKGWKSNQWLTFKQIESMKGRVLKGAKATKVCFWKLIENDSESALDEKEKLTPLFRTYSVFNLDQTSLTHDFDENDAGPAPEFDLKKMLSSLKVTVSHFGNQPHYNPKEEAIVMPHPEQFKSEADYNSTLLHELVHWTGHATRLDRASLKGYHVHKNRAEEELVAEIGSVFLATHFGLQSGELLNHAAYVYSWKECLDAKAIARAISNATKAFLWLIDRMEAV